MFNWGKSFSEWRAVLRLVGAGAPFWWRARAVLIAASKTTRALLSGPVPPDVWRDRLRVCLRCPIYDAQLKACRKELSDGRLLGCSCYVPFLAMTAAPYAKGCWARTITEHEGWPAYRFASWRAKVRAVFNFIRRCHS